MPSPNYMANGNILPSVFVKADTTADNKVVEATAGSEIRGVSHEGTRNPPGTALDDTYCAIAGEPVRVYGIGETCWVTCGGTVAAGDHLKATTNGKAITASTGNLCGGYALTAGTSGALIRCVVLPHTM